MRNIYDIWAFAETVKWTLSLWFDWFSGPQENFLLLPENKSADRRIFLPVLLPNAGGNGVGGGVGGDGDGDGEGVLPVYEDLHQT